MFGKLPDLFDKNFAIGYFLPVLAFLTSNIILFRQYGPLLILFTIDAKNPAEVLIGTTILGIAAWITGIFLLALNRDIIRLMEGYGRFNPFKLYQFYQVNRFKQLQQEEDDLDQKLAAGTITKIEARTLRGIKSKLAEQFPEYENLVLPTSFGNVIRAFERYPYIMYGYESIAGWGRLLGVISKEFMALIENEKAIVDFWANVFFLSLIFMVENIAILGYFRQTASYIWIFLALFLAWLAFYRARIAAIEWGDLVKSAFDLYLPELRRKLNIEQPADSEAQYKQWQSFSQAILYRLPEQMPPQAPPKEEGKGDSKTAQEQIQVAVQINGKDSLSGTDSQNGEDLPKPGCMSAIFPFWKRR